MPEMGREDYGIMLQTAVLEVLVKYQGGEEGPWKDFSDKALKSGLEIRLLSHYILYTILRTF